jgi:hypothetical protein
MAGGPYGEEGERWVVRELLHWQVVDIAMVVEMSISIHGCPLPGRSYHPSTHCPGALLFLSYTWSPLLFHVSSVVLSWWLYVADVESPQSPKTLSPAIAVHVKKQ